MPWHQLSLVTNQEAVPSAEIALEALGALSVTLGDAGDQPQLEPPPGAAPLWPQTRLSALFSIEHSAAVLRQGVEQALSGIDYRDLALEHLEDQCWERAWLDAFRPMRFGDRLWVCPAGQKPPVQDAVVLELDPGLAFGTGHHPTTALCLRWLDGADLGGRTLIDYGCGSGILALAGLKLGAARAIAVDHDPQALEATTANAAKNGLSARIQVRAPGDLPVAKAHILVANILAGPLVDLAPRLTCLVKPRGYLVLSGILTDQAESVAAAYRDDFDLEEPAVDEGWVRLTGRRRSPCP